MKFKLVENLNEDKQILNEATLDDILNVLILPGLASVGIRPYYIDNDKKFILLTTPLGNNFCIPIEEQSRTSSKDYKKLRFPNNGIIINGEVYDPSGRHHFGRAYYGVATSHQHLDYNPNVYQYERNEFNKHLHNPIDFNTFLNDVKAKRY